MSQDPAMPGASPEEALFSGALDIPAGPEREAWLDRACGGDAGLRARVAELLGAHETLGHLGEKPGDRLGPYVLVEKIGQGAFGSVWRARQEHPLRREVALKLINWGMDTRQVLLRFQAERQVLALLEHENIAKIYDAGATDQGRPYFVMELVRGPKITDYCDQHQLGTAARLQLFTQVCRAIQYAHDQGVIHRDLKPSNILVSEHRGVACPKIIDFGIAKATGQRLTSDTLQTADGQLLGTLSYMSPEQTAVEGAQIDARADIYSLGALLYELLIGRPPVTEAEFKQMYFDEVVRTIRKKHPPRPSERLAALPPLEREAVAQRHDTVSAKLSRLLSRHLDWVVVRCLEKDPRHRYQNAAELADRLQCHLDYERTSDFGYRLRHGLRRHRVGLGVLGAVLLMAIEAWCFLKSRPAPWREIPIKVLGYDQPWHYQWSRITWNGQEGWLAGGRDSQDGSDQFIGHGILLHTMDGGHVWQEICLTNSDAGAGTLSHFLDKTWNGIGPVQDMDIMSEVTPDGHRVTNCWIATISGIYLSTNALSPHAWWTRMTPAPDEPTGYSYFSGLVNQDNQRGFFAYGWQGIVYWERGNQWQIQMGTFSYGINDLALVDKWKPEAWAVGGGGAEGTNRGTPADFGAIYHLNGANGIWQRVTLPFPLRPQQDLNAILPLAMSTNLVVVGSGGLILRSQSVGTNFTWESSTPVKTSLSCIARSGDGNYWAVGSRGTILKSTNDCATWVIRLCLGPDGQPILDDLTSLVFREDGHAWVVGHNRVLECDSP